MKTVTLEIDERTYLIAFLKHLPSDRYVLFEDEEPLSEAERENTKRIRARLHAGDDSEFEDWTNVRNDF
ncbi:hypothetical protein [Thiocystis violascens]|uniref:Addiction module component n=1 Tax=Thiocystis violascens (strain ATCC 17096 / DSM 198 / 6111) TaxID=765911 RepID=I3Y598_THIV6|nr:hypothetical protein [Thiocystis violascens]AFL72166.1 hypothetical protein Thivi_0078 [Thiocystis violascens DSM 198]